MIEAIGASLTSIQAITSMVKAIKDSGATLDAAEAKLKFAEIIEALADAKMQIASTNDVILEKDQTIRELQEKLELKDNVVYEEPCYWKVDGEHKDGPYCQRCYDVDKRLVRLQGGENTIEGRVSRWYRCSGCDKHYNY